MIIYFTLLRDTVTQRIDCVVVSHMQTKEDDQDVFQTQLLIENSVLPVRFLRRT